MCKNISAMKHIRLNGPLNASEIVEHTHSLRNLYIKIFILLGLLGLTCFFIGTTAGLYFLQDGSPSLSNQIEEILHSNRNENILIAEKDNFKNFFNTLKPLASTSKRRKRNLVQFDIDPLYVDTDLLATNIRDKRKAQAEYNRLEDIYKKRCKKSYDGICYEIGKRLIRLSKEIQSEVTKLSEIFGHDIKNKVSSSEEKNSKRKDKKFDQKTNYEDNKDDEGKILPASTVEEGKMLPNGKIDGIKTSNTSHTLPKTTAEIPKNYTISSSTNTSTSTTTRIPHMIQTTENLTNSPIEIIKLTTEMSETTTEFIKSTTDEAGTISITTVDEKKILAPSFNSTIENLFSSVENEINILDKTPRTNNSEKIPMARMFSKIPKFHEELQDDEDLKRKFSVHQEMSLPLNEHWSKNPQSDVLFGNTELIDWNDADRKIFMDANARKNEAVGEHFDKNEGVTSVSGPFMSLCEQLIKQSPVPVRPPNQQVLNSFPSNGGIASHFTDKGHQSNFPITGESMKASAQVILNPNFGMQQFPICFFAAFPNVRAQTPPIWTPQSYSGHSGAFNPLQGGFIYVPPTLGQFNTGLNFGHTAAGGGIINQVIHQTSHARNQSPQSPSSSPQSSPYFCTYMPGSTEFGSGNQAKYHPSENHQQRNHQEDDKKYPNIPTPNDVIYATYTNETSALSTDVFPANTCPSGYVSCKHYHHCIPKEKWCNSVVDCQDSTDELTCSCKSRLAESRICDGYPDCPMQEDELGCFGCGRSMLSCYESPAEFIKAGNSTVSMCYSTIDRCDGFENCLNGQDENDCNMIAGHLGHHLTYSTSFTEGILHRNYKGKWYPVCENPLKWAREACEKDAGHIGKDPVIVYKEGVVSGPFIQLKTAHTSAISDLVEPIFTESCTRLLAESQKNVVVHVKCPQINCGIAKEKDNSTSILKIRRSFKEVNLKRNRRQDDILRVVGGTISEPLAWPFATGLYKDGHFHCGGVIYNENWILTAAHCVFNFEHHYYEVRVGMLRKLSYSPTTQIIKIAEIVPHELYDRRGMQNDIALLKTEQPIRYNKWVRPICMPSQERTTNGPDWIWGPETGTICTAVGWGAVREKGPDSDNLLEVRVPVVGRCKYKADQEGEELCAGEPHGGRDACQGDSGGPLFCPSVTNPKELYIGGVVSHGEGCARPDEPGAYTRIALYLDWLKLKTSESHPLPDKKPQRICPGHTCMWGGQRCISRRHRCDRIVDCLGAEDEVGCNYTNVPEIVGDAQNNTTRIETEDSVEPKILSGDTIPKDNEKDNKESPTVPHPHDSLVHGSAIVPDLSEKKKRGNATQTLENTKKKDVTHKNTSTKKAALKFICKKISQKIDYSNVCDRIIDCEDGTDEENCTCKDYLKGSLSQFICDGKADCSDFSDEKNCEKCKPDEFSCPLSGVCVNKAKRCDEKIDCDFKEDELDCFALSNGKKVFMDTEFRPSLQSSGLFSRNINGRWHVVCVDEVNFVQEGAETAGKVCTILGFAGYKYYNLTKASDFIPLNYNTMEDSAVPSRARSKIFGKHLNSYYENAESSLFLSSIKNHPSWRNVIADPRNALAEEDITVTIDRCQALYVECVLHSNINYSKDTNPKTLLLDKSGKKPEGNLPVKNTAVVTVHNHTHHDTVEDNFPWLVTIFIDGSLKCTGVLLDKEWVLVSDKCLQSRFYYEHYVVAVLGLSKSWQKIQTPNEQIKRIDCIKHVPNSDIVLLHLAGYAKYGRHVLPTFLPTDFGSGQVGVVQDIVNTNKDTPTDMKHNKSEHLNSETVRVLSGGAKNVECLAVTHDKVGKVKTLAVHELHDTTFCLPKPLHDDENYACFERISDGSSVKGSFEDCYGKESTNGIIVCREHGTGWYPISFYENKNRTQFSSSSCSFEKPIRVEKMSQHYKAIHLAIESGCDDKDLHYHPPVCTTLRCPLGNCLPYENICNSVVDCHDASDENIDSCRIRRECLPSEMKCRNGKCVSKTKFCDFFNDCGDLTDEPDQCSCFTYLKATDPSKICDGVRNCWDKTDENPELCRCTEHTFRCGRTNQCVPRDFICDNEKDCPGGEDENYCYSVEHPTNSTLHKSDGFAQVIEQSYGVWHTKCFPRDKPPTDLELQEICSKLGYHHNEPEAHPKPSYRFISGDESSIEDSISRSASHSIESEPRISDSSKYREATKAVVVNKFSPLRLNPMLTLYMKPSRPIAQVVKWDVTDNMKCHRLEIRCE